MWYLFELSQRASAKCWIVAPWGSNSHARPEMTGSKPPFFWRTKILCSRERAGQKLHALFVFHFYPVNFFFDFAYRKTLHTFHFDGWFRHVVDRIQEKAQFRDLPKYIQKKKFNFQYNLLMQ